jgi:hypothetical protein
MFHFLPSQLSLWPTSMRAHTHINDAEMLINSAVPLAAEKVTRFKAVLFQHRLYIPRTVKNTVTMCYRYDTWLRKRWWVRKNGYVTAEALGILDQ